MDQGHEIKLIDNMEFSFRSNGVLSGIRDFRPDVVGFSIIAARDIFNTINVIKEVCKEYPKLTLIAGGQSIIEDVIGYGEPMKKRGLSIMQGPDNDIESVTGMVASGKQTCSEKLKQR